MLLTRDAILNAQDLRYQIVEVPEWGGDVRVRGLSARERLDIIKSITDADGKVDTAKSVDLQIKVPFLCMVDDTGARLFTDVADVARLGEKSTAALDRVFDAARKLSGLSDDALEQQKKV